MPKAIKIIILTIVIFYSISLLGCADNITKPTSTSESKISSNLYLKPDIPVNQVEKQVAKKLGQDKVLISTGVKEVKWANPNYKKRLYTFKVENQETKISANTKNSEIEEIIFPESKTINKITIDEGKILAEDVAKKYYKLDLKKMKYSLKDYNPMNIWKEDFSYPVAGLAQYNWRQVIQGVETPNYVNITVSLGTNTVHSYFAHYEDIVVGLKSKINKVAAIDKAKKYARENGRTFPVDVAECRLIVGEDNDGKQILKWVVIAVPAKTLNNTNQSYEVQINALTGKAFSIKEYKFTYEEQ